MDNTKHATFNMANILKGDGSRDYLMEDHRSMATRLSKKDYTIRINELYKAPTGDNVHNNKRKQQALSFASFCK